MFGGGDALPMHGGKKADNGVSLSVVNRSVLLSLCWVFLSLFVFYYGFRHSRNYADVSDFACDDAMCTLKYQNSSSTEVIQFSRGDLKSADVVRHDGVEVIDVTGMKRKKANKVGYTVQMKLMQLAEEGSRLKVPRQILLYKGDMGRGSSRTCSKKVTEYIDRDIDTLEFRSGSGWTTFGICCILVGFFSFVASVLMGQFSDPEPKRLRKIR